MPLPYEELLVEINQTPKDQGLYSEMTARFKTWINNQTRLNATNMNELVSFIRSYSEEVGNKIELSLSTTLSNFVELNAGWKVTPDELSFDAAGNVNGRTVKNGELFNDYQNNKAEGLYSHAEGTKTSASGVASHAQGTSTQANGDNSFAGGLNTKAEGDNSTALGQNLVAEYSNQHVFGKYNQNKETNVLEVGYGTSASATKNIFEVRNDGYIFAGVDNIADTSTDNTLAPKGYVDQEIERLDKNVWLGYIDVTTEEYHNEEEFVNILNNAVKEFTQDTNPETGGRDPKNGDQITVKITNPTEEDPEYPEIWMFRDPDPKPPEEDPSSDGKWLFFSSLQQLVDASKTTKGLVKIGDNIDVSDGLISVPVGTTSVLGVLKTGTNITNVDGLIDVPVATTSLLGVVVTGDNIQNDDGRISVPIASSTVPGVIKLGENIVVDPTGTISVPVATTDTFGLVKLSDSIVLDENNQLAMVWDTW